MIRVGLFGGTFDPLHNGHINIAKYALKQAKLDEIWFIPTYKHASKDETITSFSLRVEMIQKAIKPYRKMKCSLIESLLEEPSYSYNTIKYFLSKFKDIQFFWIIGPDQYDNLENWYKIDEVKKMIQFIVVGDDIKQKDNEIILNGFKDVTRSGLIREGAIYKAPKAVQKVIIDNNLYIKSIVRAHESEKRYLHSCSVANVCMALADAHHLDINKAYLIGMLHDIAKELDKDEAKRLMQVYYPDKVDINHHIYHQYLGAKLVKEDLGIHDYDVIEAISHHVIGDSSNQYAMLLFIADKIEPTRGYDNSKHMAISIRNLKEGVAYVKKEQKEYLENVEGIHV